MNILWIVYFFIGGIIFYSTGTYITLEARKNHADDIGDILFFLMFCFVVAFSWPIFLGFIIIVAPIYAIVLLIEKRQNG